MDLERMKKEVEKIKNEHRGLRNDDEKIVMNNFFNRVINDLKSNVENFKVPKVFYTKSYEKLTDNALPEKIMVMIRNNEKRRIMIELFQQIGLYFFYRSNTYNSCIPDEGYLILIEITV